MMKSDSVEAAEARLRILADRARRKGELPSPTEVPSRHYREAYEAGEYERAKRILKGE